MTTSSLAGAVRSDVAGLLEAYLTGAWTPQAEEIGLAEGLARARWSGDSFRAVLRQLAPAVRSGRLIDVMEPAASVLDQAVVDEDTVLQLRVLIDALTAGP